MMKVSVALCVYGDAPYLSQQLDSIRSQSVPVSEIIICDDGLEEAWLSVITEYQSSLPIRHLVNETRLGVVANFEKAVGSCHGDIIALSDQDDVWGTEKVSSLIRFFETNEGVDMVFSNAGLLAQGKSGKLWDEFGIDFDRVEWNNGIEVLRLLMGGNFVVGATVALRQSALSHFLPIPEMHSSDFLHDFWFAIVAGSMGRLKGVDEVLMDYRIHSDQAAGLPGDRFSGKIRKKFGSVLSKSVDTHRTSISEKRSGLSRIHDALAKVNEKAEIDSLFVALDRYLALRGDLKPVRLVRSYFGGVYHRFSRTPTSLFLHDVLLFSRRILKRGAKRE